MDFEQTSPADRVIFFLVNALVYLRHPLHVLKFRRRCGRFPDYARPAKLEDLVQWRKLFDRNPDYAILLDKIAVKDWAQQRAPALQAPETVWTGASADDLPGEFLTEDFVIKTSNSCDQNYFPVRSGTNRESFLAAAAGWLRKPRRNGISGRR